MRTYQSLGNAFFSELKNLWEMGSVVNSRGNEQRELLFADVKIADPTDLDITHQARKFNSNYAILEFLWYLSRDPSVRNIGKVARLWKDIQDPEGNAESNYGYYIFPDQWNFVIEELKGDRDSRRATIEIAKSEHKRQNPKDIPCTEYIHFLIRNNELHLGVYMRSNDIIYGFCNDAFVFSLMQQMMLNELRGFYQNLRLGNYFHHAGSLHLYQRHYNLAKDILGDKRAVKGKRKFILRDDLTLDNLLNGGLYLPSREMMREEVLSFVDGVVLFEQNYSK